MSGLNFDDFDQFLLSQDNKIIHQVWFGLIPNKRAAKKTYEKMKLYRDSWKIKNPNWRHIEWNNDMCYQLVKNIFPEHIEMYKKYTYEIQRCDFVRYLILFRYGGVYADMDYYCNRPFDEALEKYTNDIYFVQSPNSIGTYTDHISNSLMYSKAGHPFWKKVFIELEVHKDPPYFYSKHLAVMFTTGPAILNRIYSKYKYRYRVKSLPHKLFHPFGLGDDIMSLNKNPDVYAIHIGKGSWEKGDSKFLLNLLSEWKIILFVLLVLFVPYFISRILSKKKI